MNAGVLETTNERIARSRAILRESRAVLEEAEQMCALFRSLFSGTPGSGMTFDGELRQIKEDQIRMKRDAAARARRLANGFWSPEDRDRALKYAEELEARAEELARGLAIDGPS
ncbi:MAG: hypothetical protein JSS04_28865 [Proteobacteria bacterium]|nr:hypothetical protein [Pseudomonadota bacterium]